MVLGTIPKTQLDARGVTTTYGYDALNRLTTVAYSDGTAGITYTYDTGSTPACQGVGATTGFTQGRLTRITDVTGYTEYCYNRFGDMVGKSQANPQIFNVRYGYAPSGRLQNTTYPDGAVADYVYDTLSQVSAIGVTPSGGPREVLAGSTRSYDPAGNTTTNAATGFQYLYDGAGRMKQSKLNGAVQMNYRYNGKGERTRQFSGDATTTSTYYTVYDEQGHWLGDYDATGAAKQQAIWLGDLPVGLLVGSGTSQQLDYIEADHLGTPRVVIDPDRDVAVWKWDAKSEAFGNSPPTQDPDNDGTALVFDMRFPGQRYDSASGLNYNYFRDYDASSGRYVQSDPFGLLAGNSTYSYVSGSPLGWIDFFGLIRKLDPNSQECQELIGKIENIKKDIEKRKIKLDQNPNGLPDYFPGVDIEIIALGIWGSFLSWRDC